VQDVRAEVEQKMRGGRAKKCKVVEQKLNTKCERVDQKNAKKLFAKKTPCFLARTEVLNQGSQFVRRLHQILFVKNPFVGFLQR
jgi:hypothetical protein